MRKASSTIGRIRNPSDNSSIRLKRIETKLQELGYYTYIIKEQPDKAGESVVQKVMRYALSSKFVVIENTERPGIFTKSRT